MEAITLQSIRFELRRLTDTEWVIIDHSRAEGDPERTVACLYSVAPSEFEAIWLRDLPVRSSFHSPAEALEDLIRHADPVPQLQPSA